MQKSSWTLEAYLDKWKSFAILLLMVLHYTSYHCNYSITHITIRTCPIETFKTKFIKVQKLNFNPIIILNLKSILMKYFAFKLSLVLAMWTTFGGMVCQWKPITNHISNIQQKGRGHENNTCWGASIDNMVILSICIVTLWHFFQVLWFKILTI
jgi:hypothetical protein